MENLKPIFSKFYCEEGTLREPKQYFIQVADLIEKASLPESIDLLDVGCANGAFIYFLSQRFPNYSYTGVDIFDEFIVDANFNMPEVNFINQSMLEPISGDSKKYDVVTALAVMQILNDIEVPKLFDYIFNNLKPGGRIYLFAPFNEHGIDVVLKYRHHLDGAASEWFPGGNAYSFETLEELLSGRSQSFKIIPFDIGLDLPPSDDPRRGWTIKTEKTDFQMINGLKLLMDQYVIEIHT